jgi:hypothetical protein
MHVFLLHQCLEGVEEDEDDDARAGIVDGAAFAMSAAAAGKFIP